MEYKPKVITGKVTGTGWPIDGHVLWFSQWDYDNRESWHLYGWEDSEDEVVMQTVFQTETEAGPLPVRHSGEVRRELEGKEMGAAGLVLPATGQGESSGGKAGRKHQQHPRTAPGSRLRSDAKKADRPGRDPLPPAGQEPERRRAGQAPGLGARRVPDMRPEMLETPGKPTGSAKEQGAKMLCTECAIKAGPPVASYERKAQTAHSEGGQSVKEENNTEGLYTLKIDARHYFPDGKITWDVLEALRCRKYAEVLAFYLECDLDDIEKQARRLAESTALSYSEALHKIGGDMLRSKEEKPAPLSLWPIRREPVRPNRAARRAAKRKGGRNGR